MTECPKWPTSAPTAKEMMAYSVAQGCGRAAISLRLVSGDQHRRDVNASEMIAEHDRYVLLRELHRLDPYRADLAAGLIWQAADAGDSYGEWLYEWCGAEGLDAEAICTEWSDHLDAFNEDDQ